MKVRQHIIDVISTSGSAPTRFPSTRKLAERYGVSQPTALRAVQDLIAEGRLEACPGGGTVSRPSVYSQESVRIFGFLTNLGNQSYNVYYYSRLASALGLELTRRGQGNCFQDIYLESPSLLERAVSESNLSGLALLGSPPYVLEFARKQKDKGLPVVSFARYHDGISSAYFHLERYVKTLLKKLFSEGRKRVLIINWREPDYIQAFDRGIDAACHEEGVPRGQVIHLNDDFEQMALKVEEMLGFGMEFDAVVFYAFHRFIYDLIQEKLETRDACRIALDEFGAFDELDFTGLVVRHDLETAAKWLVSDLLSQMDNPEKAPVHKPIDFDIVEYQNGVIIKETELELVTA